MQELLMLRDEKNWRSHSKPFSWRNERIKTKWILYLVSFLNQQGKCLRIYYSRILNPFNPKMWLNFFKSLCKLYANIYITDINLCKWNGANFALAEKSIRQIEITFHMIKCQVQYWPKVLIALCCCVFFCERYTEASQFFRQLRVLLC